jgi:hypothetical protein
MCDQSPGSTAGEKLAACMAGLPPTGGIADATLIRGAQTISMDPFAAINKPITLKLGPAIFETAVDITVPTNVTVVFAQGAELAPQMHLRVMFKGGIEAPLTQIFAGQGLIDISTARITETYPQWWGAKGDGVADDSQAVGKAVSAGRRVHFTRGTYLVTQPLIPAAGTLIVGEGMGVSKLEVVSSAVAHLQGISVRADNISIRDLTIEMNKSNGLTVRGIQFDGPSRNINIDGVEFVGVGASAVESSSFSLTVAGHDISDLYVSRSNFFNVTWAILKDNSDTSKQTNTVFDRCSVRNSAEGFTFNSPNGVWTGASVTNSFFDGLSSWGVGFANSQFGQIINNRFGNIASEAVHIEDRSSNISIVGNAFGNINPQTPRGAIWILSGSHQVNLQANTFDLTHNSAAPVLGVVVEPGGLPPIMAPYDVTITGNTFLCSLNSEAILISDIPSITISNNIFRNPDPSSKAPYLVKLDRSEVTGSDNFFYNPAALISVDDNSHGTVGEIRINGDLSNFVFLSGNHAGQTSIAINGFTITRPYVVDNVYTKNILFPAGTIFDGIVGMRFEANGVNTAFVATAKVKFDGATFVSSDLTAYTGSSDVGKCDVSKDGSNIVSSAFRANAAVGKITVTFRGVYFP